MIHEFSNEEKKILGRFLAHPAATMGDALNTAQSPAYSSLEDRGFLVNSGNSSWHLSSKGVGLLRANHEAFSKHLPNEIGAQND